MISVPLEQIDLSFLSHKVIRLILFYYNNTLLSVPE